MKLVLAIRYALVQLFEPVELSATGHRDVDNSTTRVDSATLDSPTRTPRLWTLGLLIGLWGAGSLVALASETPLPLRLDVRLDGRMLAFTTVVSFTIVLATLTLSAVALVARCIPAHRASKVNPIVALRAE